MEIGLITLGILACLVISYNIITYLNDVRKLKDVIEKKNKEIKKLNLTITDLNTPKQPKKDPYKKGVICLHPNVSLIANKGTNKEESLKVDFEVEILEVSDNRVKIKAIDVTPIENHKYVLEPSNRAGLLAYEDNKWVNKFDLQIIKDAKYHRNETIEDILNTEE